MIFNGEMVRAILDGRKTQTRRIIKQQPVMYEPGQSVHVSDMINDALRCPFGQVWDRIWVRETWARYNIDQDIHDMAYRATPPADWPEEGRWRPSIHMPRWASRLTLEITGVRVERLNSISQEDAQAEGMELTGWRPTCSEPDSGGEVWTPYDNFAQLWESIYGEESWKANPWVWVIEFKVVPNVQDNPA